MGLTYQNSLLISVLFSVKTAYYLTTLRENVKYIPCDIYWMNYYIKQHIPHIQWIYIQYTKKNVCISSENIKFTYVSLRNT